MMIKSRFLLTVVQPYLALPRLIPHGTSPSLSDGSRTTGVVQGKGNAQIKIADESGLYRNVTLQSALYVLSYNKDVFSAQATTLKGASVSFTPESAKLKTGDGSISPVKKKGRLYFLCSLVSGKTRPAKVWHKAKGHRNSEDLF